MSEAIVTVVIPAYKVTRYIPETLESVLWQTRQDFEIIVVNDGCPDTENLEQALAPYMSRIKYIRQENGGTSAAKNRGILQAATPYVATLDADDIWEPDYLAEQIGLLESDPRTDLVYGNARYFGKGPRDGKLFMDLCPSEGEVTFAKLARLECNVQTSVLAKKEILLKAGLFDPAFRGSEDFDLWLRVAKVGGRIAFHRKPTIRYRLREGSLTSDPPWMVENLLRVLQKCLDTLPLTEEEREAVRCTQRQQSGTLEVMRGKEAFYAGHYDEARRRFGAAQAILKSPKLSVLLAGLRVAPGMLRSVVSCRDWYLERARAVR